MTINSNQLIDVTNQAKSAKAIMTQAKQIAKSAEGLGVKLHIVLLSALNHAVKHGDTRIIDQVFGTVSQAMARGKIVTWLTDPVHSNLVKKSDKEGNVIFRKPENAGLMVNMSAMSEVSPWNHSVDPQEKDFDFDKKLAQLLDTASKKIKAGKKIVNGVETLTPKLAALEAFVKSGYQAPATPAN